MYCPQCGAENDASNKFCGKCGTPLSDIFSRVVRQESSAVSSEPSRADVPRRDASISKVSASVSQAVRSVSNSVRTGASNSNLGVNTRGSKRVVNLALDAILIVLILLPWINSYYYIGSSSFSIPELAVNALKLANATAEYAQYGLDDVTKAVGGVGIASGIVWLATAFMLGVDTYADIRGNETKHTSYLLAGLLAFVVFVIVRYVNSSVADEFGTYSSYAYGVMNDVLQITPTVFVTFLCGEGGYIYENLVTQRQQES